MKKRFILVLVLLSLLFLIVRVSAIDIASPSSNNYMIIDLSSGSVSYMDSVPSGGWTNDYKTNKLVLKKVPAGTFNMGAPSCESGQQAPACGYTNGNDIRFNPNLYKCGKVCVSLLNTWRGDQWTSCQSISTVLLTLCTLLCKDPLLNEPGVSKNHNDMYAYNEIIQFCNLDIAICDIIIKKSDVYMPFFDYFYSFIKENFNKNYDNLIMIAENKYHNEFKECKVMKTCFYAMNVNIKKDR
jgi:hypothetical protein